MSKSYSIKESFSINVSNFVDVDKDLITIEPIKIWLKHCNIIPGTIKCSIGNIETYPINGTIVIKQFSKINNIRNMSIEFTISYSFEQLEIIDMEVA